MSSKGDLRVVVAAGGRFGAQVVGLVSTLPGVKLVGVVAGDHHAARAAGDRLVDMEELGPFDIGLTAHWLSKVPPEVLRKATIGWIGYHPSFLPLYRGRNSIKASSKDPIIGGSLFWLSEGWDTGDLLVQEAVVRAYDEPLDIWINQLAPLGAELITRALLDIAKGAVIRRPQVDALATTC